MVLTLPDSISPEEVEIDVCEIITHDLPGYGPAADLPPKYARSVYYRLYPHSKRLSPLLDQPDIFWFRKSPWTLMAHVAAELKETPRISGPFRYTTRLRE